MKFIAAMLVAVVVTIAVAAKLASWWAFTP